MRHWEVSSECKARSRQQRAYYSGKQRKHTLKSQLVVDIKTKQIVCVAHGKGRQHDFKICQKSRTRAKSSIKYLADKGYQGIQKIHPNSQTPIKKKRGQKLNRQSKKINRELAKKRIIVEHINRCLKIFKLLSTRYRNRRKRLSWRLSLISGIYNYGLSFDSILAIA